MINIEPQLFLQIMQLPQSTRLDLLCFLGSVSLAPAETQKIISEFAELERLRPQLAETG